LGQFLNSAISFDDWASAMNEMKINVTVERHKIKIRFICIFFIVFWSDACLSADRELDLFFY